MENVVIKLEVEVHKQPEEHVLILLIVIKGHLEQVELVRVAITEALAEPDYMEVLLELVEAVTVEAAVVHHI